VELEERIVADPPYIEIPHAEVPAPIPSPNDPPWKVLESVVVWLLSVIFILLIPTLFLLPYLATIKPPITDPDQLVEFAKTDPTSIFVQIVAIIPAHLLTLAVAWMVVTRVRKYSFRHTLGWDTGGFRWWNYALILGVFLAIAGAVSKVVPEQENEMLRMLQSSRAVVYLVAIIATFTAPLVEEVVYRGILYSAFQKKFGIPAAFVFVTLLFALVHVPQYWPSYSTIFLLLLLSVALTAIRVKTGNLLPCIILHTVFNGFQSLMLVLEPYLPKDNVTTPDPTGFLLHLFR